MSMQQDIFNAAYKSIIERNGIPHILVNLNRIPDNSLTPYATSDGTIVLNIAMSAVGNFSVNENDISFSIYFRGNIVHATLPYMSIFSIYNRLDASYGMMFCHAFGDPVEEVHIVPEVERITTPSNVIRKKGHLTLVVDNTRNISNGSAS